MRLSLNVLLLFFALGSLQLLTNTNGASGTSAQPGFQHPLVYREASLSSPGSPPYVPADIRKAYDFTPLYSRGINGSGTRIAIIDAYGDPNLSSDLASFNSLTTLPTAQVNLYYPDGTPTQRNSGWAVETALDVEWAHAMAPGATIDNIVAFNSNTGSVFDAIAFVANNLRNETVLSMSFGQSESNYPTTGSYTVPNTHQLFVTITGHGTAAFASSGDSGAGSCCNVQYPASDPLVAAVGGTSLTLHATDSILGEAAWSGSTAGSSILFSNHYGNKASEIPIETTWMLRTMLTQTRECWWSKAERNTKLGEQAQALLNGQASSPWRARPAGSSMGRSMRDSTPYPATMTLQQAQTVSSRPRPAGTIQPGSEALTPTQR